MKSKLKIGLFIWLIVFIGIPSMTFAAPTFRIDMDAGTPGLQTDIWVTPGGSFTTNIEVLLNNSSDSLSSFGFSTLWDTGELSTPTAGNITTSALAAGWTDLSYWKIESPYIYNFSQVNFGYSQGPLTATVATINWTASNPATDGFIDIMPGFYSVFDAAYDKDGSEVTPTFEGGKVNLVPEPISSILFLSGGAALAARNYLRRRIKNKF